MQSLLNKCVNIYSNYMTHSTAPDMSPRSPSWNGQHVVTHGKNQWCAAFGCFKKISPRFKFPKRLDNLSQVRMCWFGFLYVLIQHCRVLNYGTVSCYLKA